MGSIYHPKPWGESWWIVEYGILETKNIMFIDNADQEKIMYEKWCNLTARITYGLKIEIESSVFC